ncbi:hypothetical protein NRY95_13200 [Xanthomonas campestris pv. phormiicola]|nr:hypothetical protein [Xanthomonas campestris pv. phormiicola]UYC14694.1 hypothetical protein NRY95_13200 [Xanthomonas campestris pv. phormiicola]
MPASRHHRERCHAQAADVAAHAQLLPHVPPAGRPVVRFRAVADWIAADLEHASAAETPALGRVPRSGLQRSPAPFGKADIAASRCPPRTPAQNL